MKKLLVILFIFSSGEVYSQTLQDSNYIKSLYNKGEKEYLSGNYSSAINKLSEFISIPAPVNDTTWWSDPGYQYMRMKNKAAEYLKNIYYSEKDYTKALFYHDVSTKNYHLIIPQCGNAFFDKQERDRLFVLKCYEGMNEYYNAMKVISGYVGSQQSKLADRFYKLAVKYIGSDSLKIELNRSLTDIKIKDMGNVLGEIFITFLDFDIGIGYMQYKFRFLGVNDTLRISDGTIVINVGRRERIEQTDEEIGEKLIKAREEFKKSNLYKLIMEN